MFSGRQLVGQGFVVLLVAYGAAYRTLPMRETYIGHYLEHHRRFAHGWELLFYCPAGYAESLVIRAWPSLYAPEVKCPQSVVLDTNEHSSFRFDSGPVPPPIDAIIPADVDILDHVLATARDRHVDTSASDSSLTKDCKYPDCRLDRAEEFLTEKYPRPWTISKVLKWYRAATDNNVRVDLLWVLAASRDPRAALALGETVESPSRLELAHLQFEADSALGIYFLPKSACGDWPIAGVSDVGTGIGWFQANKARLRKICARTL